MAFFVAAGLRLPAGRSRVFACHCTARGCKGAGKRSCWQWLAAIPPQGRALGKAGSDGGTPVRGRGQAARNAKNPMHGRAQYGMPHSGHFMPICNSGGCRGCPAQRRGSSTCLPQAGSAATVPASRDKSRMPTATAASGDALPGRDGGTRLPQAANDRHRGNSAGIP